MNTSADDVTTSRDLARRARELGIVLPEPPSPKGAYLPAVVVDNLVYTSGMGPMLRGTRHHVGYVGSDVTVAQAREAALIAAVNALVAALAAIGGVERLDRLVRLTGYVRSATGFIEQAAVVDRASTVLQDLLGGRGRHARSAVGVAELPFGIAVEVDLLAAVRR